MTSLSDFTQRDLDTAVEIMDEGDITASLLVLTILLDGLRGGAESTSDIVLGDKVQDALDNVISWYSDTFGDPIECARHDIKFRQIMEVGSDD